MSISLAFDEPFKSAPGDAPTGFSVSMGGSIAPTATRTRKIRQAYLAVMSFVGDITKGNFRSFAAAIQPTQTMVRKQRKLMTASLPLSAATARKLYRRLSGALTTGSAVARKTSIKKTGAMHPTATINRKLRKRGMGGTLTSSSGLVRKLTVRFTSLVSFQGSPFRRSRVMVEGSILPVGALRRRVRLLKAGTASFVGAILPKSRRKQSAGSLLSFSGFARPKVRRPLRGTLESTSGKVERFLDRANWFAKPRTRYALYERATEVPDESPLATETIDHPYDVARWWNLWWADSPDLVGVPSGTSVDAIPDRSNLFPLLGVTHLAPTNVDPILRRNAVGTQSAFEIPYVASGLSGSYNTGLDQLALPYTTVCIVNLPPASSAINQLVGSGSDISGSGVLGSVLAAFDIDLVVKPSSFVVDSQYHLVVTQWTETGVTMWVDGTLVADTTAATAYLDSVGMVWLASVDAASLPNPRWCLLGVLDDVIHYSEHKDLALWVQRNYPIAVAEPEPYFLDN